MRFATVALCLSSCFAQTAIDLAHQSRSADFSGMTHTRPAQVGTTLPALCYPGEVFFKSDAPPGKNLYLATLTSPCTWTSIAGTTASTPGGSAGQIQFNNAGIFEGLTVSGDGALSTSTGTLTITKTNGAFFAPSATTDTTKASNISSGTLASGRLPALSGDLSSVAGTGAISVLRINGTSVPANAAPDTFLGTTGSANASWFAIPNCQDAAGNHLNYNTTMHAFSCGSTSSGSGGGGSPGVLPIVDDAGTAPNVYAGCPAGSAALTDGLAVLFRAKNASTNNSTFTYCGGPLKKLVNSDGTELGAGQMPVSPIALWNHGVTKTYTGTQVLAAGDLVWDNGTAQWYMSLMAGTGAQLGDALKLAAVNPRTVMLVYHQQVDRWEIHSFPRLATSAEAASGIDNTTTVTPNQLLQSINQNAPLAAATPNKYQLARFNGSSWTGAEPASNPGSGRTGRRWIVDGSTVLRSDGMSPSLTGCSAGPAVLAPTAVTPLMLQYPSNGSVPGSYCYISNGALSPTWAGTTIKFDTQVRISATVNISYLAGVVGSAVAQSTSPLSYVSGNYGAPLAAFRFNTAAGDARWKCVASADGTTPVVADAGAQGMVDGNVHQFQIFIDDTMNTMHFYIDATEVCTGIAWGPELPAASAMTPYLGMYQTSSFGSPQTLALAYVWMEANR